MYRRTSAVLFVIVAMIGLVYLMSRPPIAVRYATAIKSGPLNIGEVRDFRKLFGDSVFENILHFESNHGTMTWNSSTTLHDRYVLTLQIPIRLNRGQVSASGELECQLTEYTFVELQPDGRVHSRFDGGVQRHYDHEDWKNLVSQNGDFESLGLSLKMDQPVKNFELIDRLYSNHSNEAKTKFRRMDATK